MKTYDLTTGSVWKNIVFFSLPMIGGSLLQQLYNIVDTYIVGIYLGRVPLAAVGSSFSLMVLLNSIVIGCALEQVLYLVSITGKITGWDFYCCLERGHFYHDSQHRVDGLVISFT